MKRMGLCATCVAVLLALLACVAGCSIFSADTEDDAAAPADVVLVDSGYDVYDGYVRYAVEVFNPNEDHEASYVRVRVVVTGADGVVKDDSYTLMRALAPGATAYWSDVAGNGSVEDGDDVAFTVSVTGEGWIEPSAGLVSDLYSVRDVVVNKMEDVPSISCVVTLTSLVEDESLDELHPEVGYLLRDGEGRIVSGGVFRQPLDLSLDEPVAFESTMMRDLPAYTTVEVFVMPQ